MIGLAFERYENPGKAKQAIARYRDKMDLSYPILHAGLSDKKEASRQLPMLNSISAFPTLIFLDKQNKVKRIYTGFYGPATPGYEDFIRDFNEGIAEINSNNL